jgi:lysyl-tRNA synthetase class 2
MAKQRLEEIRKNRLEKVKQLRRLGVDPYPSKVDGNSRPIDDVRKSLSKTVEVAGRVMGWRGHGNVVFADLKDESGTVQLWFQKNNLKDKFKLLRYFDIGDFLYVKGKVVKTKAGEVTINVAKFQLLTKSIRSLPSVWHGLKDEEKRYRRRYLDLLINDDLKNLFRRKAIFWQSMREFMLKKGFLEVETPVLENTAGGADANPFVTHHNALDIDLFLRISMGELWQKRLMVAGYEKIFEIGRQFRNEGISREHLQDYSQMEFYWAYADYEDSMALVEEMYKHVAKETFGKLEFEIGKFNVDLAKGWERIDYREIVLKNTGMDIGKVSEGSLKNKLQDMKVDFEEKDKKGRLIDHLWKKVRGNIAGPAFLVGHPIEVSPLSKSMEGRPGFVERYQVILAGSEMGNGYSELNDPIDQAERFSQQQKMRDEGDLEAQMHDQDFVEALEYGMPPVTGFGVSERLFSFLADRPIRETVLFPLLRPKNAKKKSKKRKR